ncbi:MAG: hypothetical protein J6U20_00800 [Fibrobacter sp.]|nr:hypothetical protein [Fibrobacter sp.]
MKLVETFVRDEPAAFEATQKFVSMFGSVPDPVVRVAQRAKTPTAKIAWTLLGTTLFQSRTYTEISDLMDALFDEFPDEKLWTLPVPVAAKIEGVAERVFGCRHWTLFKHLSGIFWSVGMFVRHHGGDLVAWLASRTPEEVWRDLGEVYFMGKGNPRPKACAAFYRMVAPVPFGLGLQCVPSKKMPPLPLTMGARRYLAFLGPAKDADFSEMEPKRKQELANTLFCTLNPGRPYDAAHALQFYLEMGRDDFICREQTRGCADCPLSEFCGYADNGSRK